MSAVASLGGDPVGSAGDGRGAGRSGTGWLARRWLRQRWVAALPVALIVAVGTAGTTIAFAGAQRTSSAYRDYLDRADVGDVVINPSTNTREIDEVIRSLPNVEQVTSDVFYLVTDDQGQPRLRRELEESDGSSVTTLRGSHDGRYTAMDRPAVRSGRLPTGPNEAVLTEATAAAEGLAIGDVVSIAFWRQEVPHTFIGDAYEAYMNEVVSPIGVEQVEVVGIVTLADEVLPDDLYPRQRVIVSPDIAERYDCLPASPPPGSSWAEVRAALLPPGCAVSYRYYSLSFTGGAADVKPALDEFVRRSAAMNAGLADISDLAATGLEPPQYFLITSETDQERLRVERSIRPTVAALLVLGAAAAAFTVALASLAAASELRRTQPDQRQWYQLGVSRAARAAVAACPHLLAAVAGVLAGALAGWLAGTGPLGLVRAIEPRPERRLDGVALLVASGIGVVVVLSIAILALRAARPPDPRAATAGVGWVARSLAARTGSPAVAEGLRAAYGQRAVVPVVIGGALLSGAFVASLVFGASLSALVSTPRSYGWPWDLAATTGAGYGDLDLDAAEGMFEDDPDVATWTALGLLNEVSLDGEPMMTVVGLDRVSDLDLPVLAGALPRADDEVAVGATVASARGLEVGDTVELGGVFDPPRRATVTGLVVFPTLGPFEAERVGTGTGLLLAETAFDSLSGSYVNSDVRDLATFIGVDLHDAADTPAARARVQSQLGGLDLLAAPVFDHATPVRPPEIIDASSTRAVPVGVAVVFAAVTAIGLVFASWASVRSRRRELAVLRALGFSGAQLRRSVRIQSIATMAGALAIGVPVGLIAGRVLWRAFADQLGVVPDPASPLVPVLVAAAGGVVLAILAAQVPAHLAARSTPADGLRTE